MSLPPNSILFVAFCRNIYVLSRNLGQQKKILARIRDANHKDSYRKDNFHVTHAHFGKGGGDTTRLETAVRVGLIVTERNEQGNPRAQVQRCATKCIKRSKTGCRHGRGFLLRFFFCHLCSAHHSPMRAGGFHRFIAWKQYLPRLALDKDGTTWEKETIEQPSSLIWSPDQCF